MLRSAGPSWFTSFPSKRISPREISSSPASMRSVELLPPPEGPRMARNSLSWMVKLRSLTPTTFPRG